MRQNRQGPLKFNHMKIKSMSKNYLNQLILAMKIESVFLLQNKMVRH